MTKRSHSDFTSGTDTKPLSGASKRSKQNPIEAKEAVSILANNANELSDILQLLRGSSTAKTTGPTERLVALSKTLLPALQALQTEHDSNGAAVAPAENGINTSSSASASASTSITAGKDESATNKDLYSIIPALDSLTAWTPEDIPDEYPPLPPILDPGLERMAFTHHGKRVNNFEASYENLEFLGDAFIYHVSSEIISQTFPHHLPGKCSQLRELLVKNKTLAQYAQHYGLDKRAIVPDEFTEEGRAGPGGTRAGSKERTKLWGDLFEAYIGGLIHGDKNEQGIEVAKQFLKPLWAMTLKDDILAEYEKRASMSSTNVARADDSVTTTTGGAGTIAVVRKAAKVQLSALIGCRGVTIRYEDVESKGHRDKKLGLPLFTVGVYVDAWGKTQFLGHGSAISKKEAGNKAAERALENKKMMKFYTEKKKAFLAVQEAQAKAGV